MSQSTHDDVDTSKGVTPTVAAPAPAVAPPPTVEASLSEHETVKPFVITPDEPTVSTTDEEWDDHLPLLKYNKLTPDSPSTLTSTAAAQVLLDPADALEQQPTSEEDALALLLKSDLWKQPHFVLAMGWQAGTVSLWSVPNSLPIHCDHEPSDAHPLHIREGSSWSRSNPPTVDVSLDSTGTILAAIDQEGMCCIWELKYAPSWQRQQVSVTTDNNPTGTGAAITDRTTDTAPPSPTHNRKSGMFSSFMTALTGVPPTSDSETGSLPSTTTGTTTPTVTTQTIMVPCLAASIVSTSRITYPAHWKPPTCLVLDPAHKKKSTKSLVVGFQDGRLLLTKRGGLFQRRNDTVLFQGGSDSTSYEGIECVTWRGNLVAWADASGIKLLDIDSLTRIAHIDRPTGARPTLYPTIAHVRPHLLFETASNLLVVWGDCLMNMAIQETPVRGDGTSITTRRTVQCTMAWELDCVAAGIAPLDADHVIVLGIVVPTDPDTDNNHENESEDHDNGSDEDVRQDTNEIEVQIVSRHDGTIQYADVLPNDANIPIWLESSFAPARMDNISEWNEYKAWSGRISNDMFDLSLLTGGSSREETQPTLSQPTTTDQSSDGDSPTRPNATSRTNTNSATTAPSTSQKYRNSFVDSHLQWSLKSVTFAKSTAYNQSPQNDDQSSVDSDDYGFVLRPLELLDDISDSIDVFANPPRMVLASQSDLILTTLSSVDDAVQHALVAQNRPALALKRALQHRRQLRRYTIPDLVQHFLQAVLYSGFDNHPHNNTLSLRRMKLAIQSMPVLLGGDAELWTKWTHELEQLPGAFFLLRSYLPVRDPILPSSLYEQVLLGMLNEYERLTTASQKTNLNNMSSMAVDREVANHVLESLLAWGPTKGLKEYIKFFQYGRRTGDKSVTEPLRRVEIALQRRYLQTAAGYLNFPARVAQDDQVNTSSSVYDISIDDTQDTLFSLDPVLHWVAARTPLIAKPTEWSLDSDSVEPTVQALSNDRVCLDALARLRMLHCQYDLALEAYLAIGICHSPLSMQDLESWAIDIVQRGSSKQLANTIRIGDTCYDYIMGLIEIHKLHRFLLQPDFPPHDQNGIQGPLISLMRLVGLSRVGDFLVEHCRSSEHADVELYSPSDGWQEDLRPDSLPLDLVATQLESSPALLHWYLHLVFQRKPDLYVKFPNNAIPPDAITELHRKHFQLHLKYAGEARDSSRALLGTDTYKVEAYMTPLLSFLKATLPLGGVSPVDARRTLETIRSDEDNDSDDDDAMEGNRKTTSSTFALELAYVIEHYFDQSKDEAMAVLDLLLEGVKSVMLGVSFAQRHRQYSSVLWEKLINHCLSSISLTQVEDGTGGGMLFGSLLEAAAVSGADVARLVAKIPPGMVVEGLRHRLVAAVADYRLSVVIHQAASSAADEERVALIREVAHRSRRGVRFIFPTVRRPIDRFRDEKTNFEVSDEEKNLDEPSILSKSLRPIQRRNRQNFALSLPLR